MPTATHAERTFHTSIAIPEKHRAELIELLNARLADSTDLKTQTKHAHWNVKGPNFSQLHELFDQIAPHFDDYSDLIAERAVQLGGVANGTLREAAAGSSIPEYDLGAVNGTEHVKALVKNIAKFATLVREAIDKSDDFGDKDTADIFTEISRQTDKDLWFLEAHLQG
ncbi:MAG TPA: DNA starvation/stationary phase protection protein Dps [Terriglobales bacterium]|nr:DNA starvation/stationary phase protection protein Dps [Terriglobales bacterium]